MSNEITDQIRKAAILNAIRHDGHADPQAVLGNLLSKNIELRARTKDLVPLVRQIVEEVNQTSAEELGRIARENWPEELQREKPEEERKLPPLPNASSYSVIVTRMAPNPDFVLHIGNARAAILSHDYARMYKGKFIVRFEDTDPRLKKAQLAYYDMIREDLKWLGCDWDEEYIQSDRLQIYYNVGGDLLGKGAAYVCECRPETFRDLVNAGSPCPDRHVRPEGHIKRWQKMLKGGYGEGDAVFRVKTDLRHPNPAVRDWPAFRIIDTEKALHPRVGSKFRVWPLYNLASAVDDHLMAITHVIRGKEHLTNMVRQVYLYNHMGWKYPEAVHYGRLKVEGMNLSKSKLMKGLDAGEYKGVDDPRLGTLAALRRRGFNPETIRKLIWDVGPKPVDVTISWENINAQNRKLIDGTSPRYYFVADPVLAKISGVRKNYVVHPQLHPEKPEMGTRTLTVDAMKDIVTVFLAGSDRSLLASSKVVRLMGLFNFRPDAFSNGEMRGEFLREDVLEGAVPILQWVPFGDNVLVDVVMPDASVKKGFAERGLRTQSLGSVLQFVRFGFGRLDDISDEKVTLYYTHD